MSSALEKDICLACDMAECALDLGLDCPKIDKPRREKVLEQQRAYRERNREKIREYQRAYRERNREKIREYQRAYRERNREKNREYQRAYRERNREKLAGE